MLFYYIHNLIYRYSAELNPNQQQEIGILFCKFCLHKTFSTDSNVQSIIRICSPRRRFEISDNFFESLLRTITMNRSNQYLLNDDGDRCGHDLCGIQFQLWTRIDRFGRNIIPCAVSTPFHHGHGQKHFTSDRVNEL